jgi:hypothetical protein
MRITGGTDDSFQAGLFWARDTESIDNPTITINASPRRVSSKGSRATCFFSSTPWTQGREEAVANEEYVI